MPGASRARRGLKSGTRAVGKGCRTVAGIAKAIRLWNRQAGRPVSFARRAACLAGPPTGAGHRAGPIFLRTPPQSGKREL